MKADSIEQLLQAERGRKGFSQEQRAGLWKGIESSIGPIIDPGTPPEKPAPPNDPPNNPPKAAPPADGGAASSVAEATKRFASLKVGALVAVAAIGGAGIGAAAHARWGEPRVVVVDRITESALAPSPPAANAPTVAPVNAAPTAAPAAIAASALPAVATNRPAEPRVATSAASTAASTAASASASAARDPGLARERNLLDMARTALSRGDTSAALSAVDNHSREFPKSQLAEEREVLAIQALASAGRLPEARRRGAAFRTSFPKSSLLPIVDESTQ